MKITEVVVYDVPLAPTLAAGRQHLWIVEIRTDEGITGTGEIGLAYGIGGRGAAHVAIDLAEQYLVGRSALRIEEAHDDMVRSSFWGMAGGAIFMAAVSALDEALWDIQGKHLGVPVHRLFGGPLLPELRLYANGWYRGLGTPEQYAEAATKVMEDGYTALKFDPFKTALDGTTHHPRRTLDKDLELLALARLLAVREAVGNADIIVEFHGNLWPVDAIRFGHAAAEILPYYYEEPVEPFNVTATSRVAARLDVPIAGGERLWSRHGFREFLDADALQLIQPDIGVAGGFTEVRKIAALAESYCAYVQPHNCGGPISTAAAVALSASIPNFLIQEIFPYWDDDRYDIVDQPYEREIVNGHLVPHNDPGIGISLNHDFLDRFDTLKTERQV